MSYTRPEAGHGEQEVLRSIRLYCENQGDKFRYHAGRILGMMSALGDGDRDDPSGVQDEHVLDALARDPVAVFEEAHAPTAHECTWACWVDRYGRDHHAPTLDVRDARARILAKFDRLPDADAVMIERADALTALRRTVQGDRTSEDYDSALGDGDRDDPVGVQGAPSDATARAIAARALVGAAASIVVAPEHHVTDEYEQGFNAGADAVYKALRNRAATLRAAAEAEGENRG